MWVSSITLGILVLLVIILRIFANGSGLAEIVTANLNGEIRGRVTARSIEWPLHSIYVLATGGWLPVTARGVTVRDAEGNIVISAEYAYAELDVHPAIFGNHDLHFRNMQVDCAIPSGKTVEVCPYAHIRETVFQGVSVVSLVSAFYPRTGPQFNAGVRASADQSFHLHDYQVEEASLDFTFPYLEIHVEGTSVKGGNLHSRNSDPLRSRLTYSLSPKATKATIQAGGKTLRVRDIHVATLAQEPEPDDREGPAPSIRWDITARSLAGGLINFQGGWLHYWDNPLKGNYQISLDIANSGDILEHLTNGIAQGRESTLRLQVAGSAMVPTISLQSQKLDVVIPFTNQPLALHVPEANASFELATKSGNLTEARARGTNNNGELAVRGAFELSPAKFDVIVDIARAINLYEQIPIAARGILQTNKTVQLRGNLRATGGMSSQYIDNMDLRLGKARVQGALRLENGTMARTRSLQLRIGKTTIYSQKGSPSWYDLSEKQWNLNLGFQSQDLPRWLRHFNVPPVAEAIDTGTLTVQGTPSAPIANAKFSLSGIPVVGTAQSEVVYENDQLKIRKLVSNTMGGQISATGNVRVPHPAAMEQIRASLRNIHLSQMPKLGPILGGVASGNATIRGPVGDPHRWRSNFSIEATGLTIADDEYSRARITGNIATGGSQKVHLYAKRKEGGIFDTTALLRSNRRLAGKIAIEKLPLETLTLLGGAKDSPLGGILSTALDVGGSLHAPTLAGTIHLGKAWFRSGFLGNPTIHIQPTRHGVRFQGTLLQGRISFAGTLDNRPPYDMQITVHFHQLEVDQFNLSFARQYGLRGWATGELTLRMPLQHGNLLQHVRGTLLIQDLVALLDKEDSSGRPTTLTLRNKTPFQIDYDGKQARLTTPTAEDRVVFAGPTGDFTVRASGNFNALALHLSGIIDVDLLAPYLSEYLDELTGRVTVEVHVTGPASQPTIQAIADFHQVTLKPTGQETRVSIPSGIVDIRNHQISFTNLRVLVADEVSSEQSELFVRGGVKLAEFIPQVWAVSLEGRLAGAMLLVAAPQAFSAASGSAALSVALIGTGTVPPIDGRLTFDTHDAPLRITPRGVRRELRMTSGSIKFTSLDEEDQELELENIEAWVDDEGYLTAIRGVVGLISWSPADVDVTFSARALPLRVPENLELNLGVDDFRVYGDSSGLVCEGVVEISDGRYFRDFDFTELLTPKRTTETTTPYYQSIPLIATMEIDNVEIEVPRFTVNNNIAVIDLSGRVTVSGTPAAPILDGSIEVENGTFDLPLFRTKFTRTEGTVSFSRLRRFPKETPSLDIRSEADYQDPSGQQHLITLELRGPLSELAWNLYSDTGLNKGQTTTLLTLGRTPEEVRSSLGDEAIGKDPTQPDSLNEENSYDQFVREITGQFISLLIDDKLRELTAFEVSCLEISSSSIRMCLEKEFSRNLRFSTEFEKTPLGLGADGKLELRILDGTSLGGELRWRRFEDETKQNLTDLRFQLVHRLPVIP